MRRHVVLMLGILILTSCAQQAAPAEPTSEAPQVAVQELPVEQQPSAPEQFEVTGTQEEVKTAAELQEDDEVVVANTFTEGGDTFTVEVAGTTRYQCGEKERLTDCSSGIHNYVCGYSSAAADDSFTATFENVCKACADPRIVEYTVGGCQANPSRGN